MTETVKRGQQEPELYAYDIIEQKQRRASRESGIISIALARNIAALKEPTLFDDIEEGDAKLQELRAVDQKHLVDRKGKPVSLTRYQTKIIYALALFMSQERTEEEIQNYVKKLASGRIPKSKIDLPISITELTKLTERDGTARARQKEKVLEELRLLSEIRQVQTWSLPDNVENRVRFTAPLITIQESLEDLSPDKRLNADFVRVTFGALFFVELYTKYAVIKPSLFRLWGQAGSGTDTELFSVLLSELLANYSGHRIAAIRAAEKLNARKYKTEAAYEAAKRKVMKEALTYREYAHTLRDRIPTDYESQRAYKARFKVHLQQAIDALIRIGLLTEDTQIVQAERGLRIDFVYNFDYDKNEPPTPLLLTAPQLL